LTGGALSPRLAGVAKPIPIKNTEEFTRLLKTLVNDIRDSHDSYQLYRKLAQAVGKYETEFHQSPAFWNLAMRGLIDSAVLRLCRVYDQHNTANHLHGWLLTIQANPALFEEAQFRERLKDNPAVDLLAMHGTIPNRAHLENDLALTSEEDPDVSVLLGWRGSVVAHSSVKIAKGDKDWTEKNPLSWELMEKLIARAFEVFNRYSALFNATSYSTMLIGENDYKNLLELLRLGLKKSREDRGV
jgi:hypothetical protein